MLSTESDGRVATGDLQSSLGLAPGNVTEMVAKLDERGLLDHEKYRGVRLTDRGETHAARAARRFCVVSTFFESALDAELADGTAFDIGVTLLSEGIRRLRERTDAPCLDRCPESECDGGDRPA